MNAAVSLIGAPTDIGASVRGASMGPEALRVAQLQQRLEAHGLQVADRGNLVGPANPWQAPQEGYRHLAEVTARGQRHRGQQGEREPACDFRVGTDHLPASSTISRVSWSNSEFARRT